MSSKILWMVVSVIIVLSCNTGKQKNLSSPKSHIDYSKYEIYPPSVIEEKTDTVLYDSSGNSLKITISKVALDSSFVLDEAIYEDFVDTVLYRDWEVGLEILNNQELIFSKKFQKKDFADQIRDSAFIEKSILKNMWITDYDKSNNQLSLLTVIGVPETDFISLLKIIIQDSAIFEIALLE